MNKLQLELRDTLLRLETVDRILESGSWCEKVDAEYNHLVDKVQQISNAMIM